MSDFTLGLHDHWIGLDKLGCSLENLFKFAHFSLVNIPRSGNGNSQKEGAKCNGQCVEHAGLAHTIFSNDQGEAMIQSLFKFREPFEIR